MARPHRTEGFARTEDAVIVLFCLTDEAYAQLNPRANSHGSDSVGGHTGLTSGPVGSPL